MCLLLDLESRLRRSSAQLFRVITYSNTELNKLRFAELQLCQNVVPICVCFRCFCICSVSPGFDAMKDQNICNKIMVKLIQNCRSLFESSSGGEACPEERSTIIAVKVLCYVFMNHASTCSLCQLLFKQLWCVSSGFLLSYPAVIDSSADLDQQLRGLNQCSLFGC